MQSRTTLAPAAAAARPERVISGERPRRSAAEWATRVDCACAYRLVRIFGMDDIIYNHISARIPGAEEPIPCYMDFDENHFHGSIKFRGSIRPFCGADTRDHMPGRCKASR